jgi:L-cysteate sulfo-lyase
VPRVHELAQAAFEHLNVRLEIPVEAVQVNDSYLGEGYAALGDAERNAITLLARHEGLLVDPVYTGRALAGLVDLIRTRHWRTDEMVLFWHSGGAAALFAYADRLLAPGPPNCSA